jgi:hypothetical protein
MRTLKIYSLPTAKVWIDRDEIMLHACFQILEDCVEKEKVDTHCNYKAHKKFVDEVRFLYKWWKGRNQDHSYSNKQTEEDNKMLIRLMKIRTALWT